MHYHISIYIILLVLVNSYLLIKNWETNNIFPKPHTFVYWSLNSTFSLKNSFYLGRHLKKEYPIIVGGKGNYIFTADGRKVFDASSGAAVSCLGHNNKRIINAMIKELKTGIPYIANTFWTHITPETLSKKLINGTNGKMSKVYLTGSGSEAMEASLKISRQYFYETDKQTSRTKFIARHGSYHGNTLGALSVSGHFARRAPYIPFLMDNVHFVSSCNPYRQRLNGESNVNFVARKAKELDAKFQELGPETVIAFIAEPVVGAALGCVPSVPGYLKAMRDVCHKYGALFILDEVMCGIGRTGNLHAWEAENIVPDIQTIGKGLGAGYQSIAATLISQKVVDVLLKGSGQFIHGHTYQGMPIQASAALEVLRIIEEKNLLSNISKQGTYLEQRLKISLENHPNVGDIRGRGLFWGIEFVKDKITKESFNPEFQIAQKILNLAISPPFNMTVYPGNGTVNGIYGDHIIIAPPYFIKKKDVDYIVNVLSEIINITFNKY